MTMTKAKVLLTIEDNIATVTLNRPEKHNGLDWEMMNSLIDTAKQLRKNKSIRAVVIRANGESFCAGLDFGTVMKNPKKVLPAFLKWPWQSTHTFQEVAWAWRRIPVPVIAAVRGSCIGGGLQIALAADIRFVTSDAKLSIMEIKWGLVPDMCATVLLNELLSLDKAKDLLMTGRVVSGTEAVEINLASWVSENPEQAALEYAQLVCSKSPDAVSLGKRLISKNRGTRPRKALKRERIYQAWLLTTPNQKRALKAGMKKVDAKFENRKL